MLKEIQTRILEQVDWRPTYSAEFLALLTRMINRAYQVLFNDMPFLLEQEVKFITQPDVVNATSIAGDRVYVEPTDRRVLSRVNPVGGFPTGAAAWVFDGTWDGRWVELTGADGIVHRRQTREWWQTQEGGGLFPVIITDHFTIETPWHNNTDTGMVYRVYTPEYHLPSDVVEIKSARTWTDTNHLLRVAMQGDMEQGQLLDYRGRTQGIPEIIYKGKPYQLQAPTIEPLVDTADASKMPYVAWAGPDNAGEFDFCFTYGWGNRDADELTPLGLKELKWESGSSPISDKISTINDGAAIVLKLPDVDFELGFNTPGKPSATHSGLRKRIYVRRHSVYQGGGISRRLESPEVFMLLAEVPGDVTTFIYDGSLLADYLRRLRPINGYQSLRIYPIADNRYEIDCRVQFRPAPLVNSYDAPRLNEDGMDALVQKALSLFLNYDGKPELGAQAESQYQSMIRTLTKRYATIAYGFVHKKPARVRRQPLGMRSRAVTYHEPT